MNPKGKAYIRTYGTADEYFFDEETAIVELLVEGVLLASDANYKFNGSVDSDGRTIIIVVNASDLFAWACADSIDLTMTELPYLYDMWKADTTWGVSRWICIKEGLKPQRPIVTDMKKSGVWDSEMEALKDNMN